VTDIEFPGSVSLTIAIVVFFIGAGLNGRIAALRQWNIPEAVTGGLLAALVTLLAYRVLGIALSFDLVAQDLLLLNFFTSIGLNARLADLIAGGKPLMILLGLTLVYLVIKNLIAAGSAVALGLPGGITVLLRSASLIGGHGTTIAWAPILAERFGLTNAMEIGVAAATPGLVIASLVGGPVVGLLIARYRLKGPEAAPSIGLPDDEAIDDDLNHITLLRTILVLNVAVLIGYTVDELLTDLGFRLPLFVACLLAVGDRLDQCHSAGHADTLLADTHGRAGACLRPFR
jgi:ESS family glutamate:Na+ symporter